MRLVTGTLATLAAATLGAAGLTTAGAGASTPAVSSTPTGLRVTPGVGQVTLSWNAVGSGTVRYAVASSPVGLTCATTATSCAVPARTSTPYTFTVTATQAGSTTSPASAPTPALKAHLVLVEAGQSNANGFESYAVDPTTHVNYFAAPYKNGADTHDLLTWLPWSQLQGAGATPVGLDSPQQIPSGTATLTIFGPEVGLARQLWTDTGRSVTVVKGAHEGTSLALDWNPKKSTGPPPGGLFAALVAKVDSVLVADAAAGQFDVLGGVYWYQGETDASKNGWAKKYQVNLTKFIAALRTDLPMAPTAPVVLAEEDTSQYIDYVAATSHLTSGREAAYRTDNAEVRAADVWAAANLPDVVDVDTAPLARVAPEDVHLSDVAELALGDQMAAASEHLLP